MRVLIVDEEIIGGGVETIRRRLIPELAGLVEAIVWVLPGHAVESFRGVEKACGNMTIETLNSTEGLARIKEGIARRAAGGLPRGLVDERLRRLAREYQCDVCMTTCVFGQEIPGVKIPVTGFVSDVNPALPESVLNNIGKWVERTAMTFAISDFTCSELKRMKPECSGRIYSIPLAGPARVKSGESIPGTFYYPAAPNGHKGHLVLLEAARGLALRGMTYRLTLTGAGMDGQNGVVARMRAFLADNRELMDGRVALLGDARAADVERCFAEASCVVLPSSYEGFGLPLAEALGYGKQVICSDIPPFREQIERYGCEEMAVFVPPGDAAALEKAMAAHLSGEPRTALTPDELGEHLNRWTWTDAAKRCHELLEEAHG